MQITLGEATVLDQVTVRMPRAVEMRALVDGREIGITVHVSVSPINAEPATDEEMIQVAAEIGAALRFCAQNEDAANAIRTGR